VAESPGPSARRVVAPGASLKVLEELKKRMRFYCRQSIPPEGK
jgi:hypothetical protein